MKIKERFEEIVNIYANRPMMTMVALGFASGFPFLLIFSVLSLWLKEAGWSYAAIGAFSLVKIPYTFKWLWSPLIDNVKVPLLWRLGRRRSWALFLQVLIFVAVLAMSQVNPAFNPQLMWFCAFAVSFSSASLDIVLDAFRVETFQDTPEEQAAGSAMFVLGYRLGFIFSGAGALWVAAQMSWGNTYIIMALGSLVGFITLLLAREPNQKFQYVVRTLSESKMLRVKKFLRTSIKDPFVDFAKHQRWALIVFFIFIYRMGDAYMSPMAFPFYDDIGFSKVEIAYIIKLYGMVAAIVGSLVGGVFLKKVGLFKGLYICGFAQGITTMFFAIQAVVGYNTDLLTVLITLDNFASGLATTALVAYISSLCNMLYTATQYALLSSVVSLARDAFASTSGLLADTVSWPIFFILAGLFSVPGILLVHLIADKKEE